MPRYLKVSKSAKTEWLNRALYDKVITNSLCTHLGELWDMGKNEGERLALTCALAAAYDISYRAMLTQERVEIAFPRDTARLKNGFWAMTRISGKVVSQRAFLRVIDKLEKYGLITQHTGHNHLREDGSTYGISSTYYPTEALFDIIRAAIGIKPTNCLGYHDKRIIRRYKVITKREANADGKVITKEYRVDDTDAKPNNHTEAMRKQLEAYNLMMNGPDSNVLVTLHTPVAIAEEVTAPLAIPQEMYPDFVIPIPPNVETVTHIDHNITPLTHTKRIFSHGSWQLGGRFYSGITNLPNNDEECIWKNLRQYIRIDGEECIELDYQGMQPRMLYSMLDMDTSSKDDIYASDNCLLTRKNHKKVLLWAINCGNETKLVKTVREYAKNDKEIVLGAWTPETLVYEVLGNHMPLMPYLVNDTPMGLELQYKESRIMAYIMKCAVKRRKPFLSIHDGLICKVSDKDYFYLLMKEAYKREMKYEIPVKVK